MAYLATLIPDSTDLLLTGHLHARLLPPLVIERRSHKPYRSSQSNAAQSPHQREPSACGCHSHLTTSIQTLSVKGGQAQQEEATVVADRRGMEGSRTSTDCLSQAARARGCLSPRGTVGRATAGGIVTTAGRQAGR